MGQMQAELRGNETEIRRKDWLGMDGELGAGNWLPHRSFVTGYSSLVICHWLLVSKWLSIPALTI